MKKDMDKGVFKMSKRFDLIVLDRPPVPTVTDHEYDNYDGFEFYPIASMPMHFDPETGLVIKKKEVVYL